MGIALGSQSIDFTIEYPLPPALYESYHASEGQITGSPVLTGEDAAIDADIAKITGKERAATSIRKISSRIADIHLLAMDSNPLLHAQFPTAESLAAVRRFLIATYEEAVLANGGCCSPFAASGGSKSGDGSSDGSSGNGKDIPRSSGILVARKTTRPESQPGPASGKEEEGEGGEKMPGEIVGFATWEYTPRTEPPTPTTHDGGDGDGDDANAHDENRHPKTSSSKLETGISNHVEGCRKEFLDQYARLTTQAKERCFGDQECYRMFPLPLLIFSFGFLVHDDGFTLVPCSSPPPPSFPLSIFGNARLQQVCTGPLVLVVRHTT